MLAVLDARFARRIAHVIRDESADLLAGYRKLGYVPPPEDRHFQAVQDVYRDLVLQSVRTFGRRVLTQAKSAGIDLETKQEEGEGFFTRFFRSLTNLWVNQEPIRRRIQSVTETTRNQIVKAVAEGQEKGLGVDAIARGIAERLPQISRQRGALIARTETHGAANFAMHETAKTTGLDLVKEWVSVEDHRTRAIIRDDEFGHLRMDGQARPMDEPFSMPWRGREPLAIMYPGEAGKPGGAVINCRCAVVHRVAGFGV